MSTRLTEEWLANRLAKQGAKSSAAVAQPLEATTGRKYSFVVFGEAEPAGSKQAFVPLDKKTKEPYRRPNGGIVVSVVDANKHADRWKKYVAKIAREEYSGPVFDGFLKVTFIFYQARPQGHYTSTGKMSKQGREKPWPNVKPDVLKFARAIEDALTGVVYVDDAIIVDEHIRKEYGTPPRVEITIEELDYPEDEQPVLFEEKPPWER